MSFRRNLFADAIKEPREPTLNKVAGQEKIAYAARV
jgi:hypothetical protein